MPTPNLYAQGGEPPFSNLPSELETPRIDLLYVTDRAPDPEARDDSGYGWGRSRSLAFGSAIVEIDGVVTWEALHEQSAKADRDERLSMTLKRVDELHRYPPTPFPISSTDGLLVVDPDAERDFHTSKSRLRAELKRRLALTPGKEVIVYVHGFNNAFADAAFAMAELWHFSGREGVPLLYTWPAGRGGTSAYGYDRESGQFTLFHLKQLLRSLGDLPEVERIQIVAHSRGTDVATSALRELFIEARAAGEDPRSRYRISNLVLAAPDLDGEVFSQRVVGERIGTGVGQVTVYTSQGDKAIGLAEKAFGSVLRLGRAGQENIPPEVTRLLDQTVNVAFVESPGRGDPFGHGYILTDPATSSDLILVLRYGRRPGAQHGRPLTPVGPGVWSVDEDYPGGP